MLLKERSSFTPIPSALVQEQLGQGITRCLEEGRDEGKRIISVRVGMMWHFKYTRQR